MGGQNFKRIRARSIKRIKKLNLLGKHETIDVLPILSNVKFRNVDEIISRAVILGIFKLISVFPEDLDWYRNWLIENDFYNKISKKEHLAIEKVNLEVQDEIDFSWYQESINCIMWVLGFKKAIIKDVEEVDCTILMQYLPPDSNIDVLSKRVKLISEHKIVEELDFYYLLHWLSKRNSNISQSVVKERRKILEWCMNSDILLWDEVPMDT